MVNEKITKGDVEISEHDELPHANIDVGEHEGKIVCYGETRKEAKQLRKKVMKALRNAK